MQGKIIAMLAVAAAVLSGCVCMLNSAEATEEIQDGSSTHPYLKTVSIPTGQTKTVYISVNLAAFEFVQIGDGYYIDYGVGYSKNQINGRLTEDNGKIPTWPTSKTTLDTEHLTIKPIQVDLNGNFGFAITLNSSSNSECVVDVCLNLISMSVFQCINYKIKVVEQAAESYELTFPNVTINSDYLFSTQGTLKVGGSKVTDLSKYSFYAVGLYSGIIIHNDLSIKGLADLSDSQWASGKPITFKVAITDTESKSTVVVDAVINYTISPSVSSLNFTVNSGSDKVLDGLSTETKISVLSGTALTLEVMDGTEASVVYTGENSSLKTAQITSTTSTPGKQALSTLGNGTYEIFLSKSGISDEKVITINVLGSLTALNSIRVSCAPLSR